MPSKQDYELIASVLYAAREAAAEALREDDEHWTRLATGQDTEEAEYSGNLAGQLDMVDELIQQFADALRATNPAFQRAKFERACKTGQHIRRSILPRP